ncbi:MAG: hypothetical protein VYA06_03985 [Chloroflexota bacterium]|nr:hypothetical protein [Chloroflexota bacterium]MEC9451648.1 hypothetical protein [Chloroflexota bacterium]MQG04401.1 hypothetical protein [SAR202 cluster bacterium]|tara:strand:+ start:2395 stop:2817 length:423 start_codon:yes stop_codon:yes gene_type:complete
MTISKNKETQLRKGVVLYKSTKGIRLEKNIENNNLVSEIKLNEINGYELSPNKKDNSQAMWAIAGFLLAILVWQLSSVPMISIAGSIILVLVSLFLSLDYIFAKTRISLILYINGKDLREEIDDENIDEIREFLKTLKIS